MKDERLKKLLNALRTGSPLKIALRYAGIQYSEYRYWLSVYASVVRCQEEQSLRDLKKDKTPLAAIRERSFAYSKVEDENGRMVEPDAEAMLLYSNSKAFREKADEISQIVIDIDQAKTGAILRHLTRITKEGANKTEVAASQWFLERALPQDFGKEEKEQLPSIEPIKVNFVTPSDASLKRIEDMEKSILGETKTA